MTEGLASLRIAVTGATGFIGRALVDEYVKAGASLRILARKARAPMSRWQNRVEVIEGSLQDTSAVTRLVDGASTVIHLAYLRDGAEANLAAANVLASAARTAGVKRVVHCSTAVVVGPAARGTIDETVPDVPRGPYQTAKLAIEDLLRREVGDFGELVILRPTDVLGQGGEGLRSMIRRLADRRAPARAANIFRHVMFGARRFNYVCIRNVVAGLRLLAEAPGLGGGAAFYLSDDDDPENCYAAVEARILSGLERHAEWHVPTIPRSALSLAYRMLPDHAPPNRAYSTVRIRAIGYRKATSLAQTIDEVVAFERGRLHAD